MRFGGFSFGSWHESESHGEVLTRMVDLAVQADRLGLDSFWLGEHHFSRHGILADTMVMASHIAARTDRIRIGTAVIVLPLHNPVRVAEQIAIVDHLSGGRIDVGVGIGYQQREFAGLGVDIDEARARFVESPRRDGAGLDERDAGLRGRIHAHRRRGRDHGLPEAAPATAPADLPGRQHHPREHRPRGEPRGCP